MLYKNEERCRIGMTSKRTIHSTYHGAEILNIDTHHVINYSFPAIEGRRCTQPSVPVVNADFCNVTITHTHPGQNDSINVEAWLPTNNYNGRLQAIDGGGWVAGRFILSYAGMAGAVADGYATAGTDAGLGDNAKWTDWILQSPGHLNTNALASFGHLSYHEESIIVKQLIEDFYGSPPDYSYWNACSNGGRQGMMLAQRYPNDFHGIIAAAPAIDWAEILIMSLWGTFYMDISGNYPHGYELDELTKLGVTCCDELDGVKDGLIADTKHCKATFNAHDHIGSVFDCTDTGNMTKISRAAAEVAVALYNGAVTSSGDFVWCGFEVGANLKTLAPTNCTGGTCTASAAGVATVYNYFVDKSPSSNRTRPSYNDFDLFVSTLKDIFNPSVEANSTDLNSFEQAGGKMLTYHGLSDQSIPPQGSLEYYQAVSKQDPKTSDFYRLFPVPGLQHCFGGNGGQPVKMFDQLRQWVENGTGPDASPVKITAAGNSTKNEYLCAWPLKATLDPACTNGSFACWSCS